MDRKTTIIVGANGSGKTTLAQQLAKAFNKPVTVDGEFLTDRFPFASVPDDADVVIVEDVDFSRLRNDIRQRMKSWLTSPVIRVDRKYQAPVDRAAPHFIFTTGDANPLNLDADDRRFHVVRLAG